MTVRMQRLVLLGLLALGATLALPSLSRADMEKDAAHMLALAQADAQWVTETMGDNLDYEASLADSPGISIAATSPRREGRCWESWVSATTLSAG